MKKQCSICLLIAVFVGILTCGGCKWERSFTPIEVTDLVVCEDVDENLNPLNVNDKFDFGVRQLCVWFKYRFAGETDLVKIKWIFEGNVVFIDTYSLIASEGQRAFFLLREDGSPLLGGKYEVDVFVKGQLKQKRTFFVVGSSDQEGLN